MKLTKENVCVFIEDEAQLEQARELLVKYNQRIFEMWFNLIDSNNLAYDCDDDDWFMITSSMANDRNEITLTELEKILIDGKETE